MTKPRKRRPPKREPTHCDNAKCPGYVADKRTWYIERCDDCAAYPNDDAALRGAAADTADIIASGEIGDLNDTEADIVFAILNTLASRPRKPLTI